MKVLSLFDGISCGMVALERAGIPVERYVAYEIDEDAKTVSNDNYPIIEQCGDVFQADFRQYRGFDLLLGGSPCTYWSIAQSADKRETTSSGMGFELFMQYVRALRESECKYFLYENNKSMSNDIKAEITKHLGVEPIMINSALVSAQNRERYYWTNIPNVKLPEDKHISLVDILVNDDFKPYNGGALIRNKPDLTEKVDTMYMIGATNKQCSIGCRVYDLYGKAKTLCSQAGAGGAKAGLYYVDGVVKNLRVSGAEKLQTLPVGYTKVVKPETGISLCGNGWTVDVIAWILSHIPEQKPGVSKWLRDLLGDCL
jgi:DNA (cytosine-5)-methyltransferase 3A